MRDYRECNKPMLELSTRHKGSTWERGQEIGPTTQAKVRKDL